MDSNTHNKTMQHFSGLHIWKQICHQLWNWREVYSVRSGEQRIIVTDESSMISESFRYSLFSRLRRESLRKEETTKQR
jgi:hypothetical protein